METKLITDGPSADSPEEPRSSLDGAGAASRLCPACEGPVLDAKANFCGACGSRLAMAAKPAPGAGQAAAGASSSGEPDLVTEIKYATVVFVDLVKSTEMVASLDAEGAMQRLRPILDVMCRTAENFGGSLLSTLGDGIMALFGALRTEEDHAALACQAVLAIRTAISAQPGSLAIRAGLHSGEIVVHHRKSDPAGSLKAYGVTLHLASRLTGEVDPGRICLSDACQGLVRQVCTTQPLGERRLRGVPHPMRLHLLDGMAPARARPAFASSVPSFFLGRDDELRTLARALDRTLAGAGGTISIVGGPGMGKSRLCHEFEIICQARQVQVHRTSAQPHGASFPLRSLALLLRNAYFGPQGPGSPPTSATVSAVLARIDAPTATDLALVCGLLGIPHQERSPLLTAEARITRLVDVIGRLARLSGDGPRVLVFEDVHWIDAPSKVLLSALARAVRDTGTLLVINGRPADAATWLPESVHSIELAELSPSDAHLLVERLIGPSAELLGLRTQVVSRSAGNPFFAEELVRSLVEDGAMIGDAGAYSPGGRGVATSLPLTVQAVIGSRIDHLKAPDRDLLYVSAVIGKDFEPRLLQAVAQRAPGALSGSLDRLCAAGLVDRHDHGRSGRYEFRHPLIQEVAYNMQLRERRSHLHAAIAGAMRRLYPDCDGDMAGVIAVHLEEAGRFGEAAVFAARAARWVGQHSSSAAIERWHKVRALVASDPASDDGESLRIEANGQIGWLGWREGYTVEQAEPYLQEALASATRSNHPLTSLLMLARGRMAQFNGGDADVFVSRLRDAAALAESQGDRGRMATMQVSLSHAYGWAGLLRQALAANDAALADAHLATDADHRFLGYNVEDWARSLRGRILLRLGALEPARECFDHMIGLRDSIDPTVAFIGHFGHVELAQHLSDEATASEHAGHLDELARKYGNAYLTFYAAVARALADGIADRLDAAIRGTQFCLELLGRGGAGAEFEPELLANLAGYQKRAGLLAEARATSDRALSVARARNARLPLCRVAILRAETTVLMGVPGCREEAGDSLEEAGSLLESTGAQIYRPLLDRAHRALA